MKDFDIREIEFEEDDLPVEGDFEDIEDELHNLCFATDEEGNEVPYFCQLDDIAMIYNLDEDEIIDIAYENGYKVYSVFNTDIEEETLVIAAEGFGADEIKSVYEEMFEDETFEVEELAQEGEEDDDTITEAPDKYGLPTDDELDAEKSDRINSIEKDYADRKARIADKRKKFQDAEKVFTDACNEFKSKNSEKLASLYKDFLEGKILSLSTGSINGDKYINYIYAYSFKPLCFDIKDGYGFDNIYVDIKNGDISCDRPEKVNYNTFAEIVKYISDNFDKFVELIKKHNAEETKECLERFKNLFTSTQDIVAIRNVSNPGHWAWGDCYVVFSAFGKVFHYEDYNSGAYTNKPTRQFRCFNVIKSGDRGCYSYDSPVFIEINPEDVGLEVSQDSWGSRHISGQIDVSELSYIGESLKESKTKKTTYKDIKDVIEEILSEDFLGKKDTLSQEELDVIHSVINKRIRGLDNVINCLKEIKKQIGNKKVVRFFHYGRVMSLNNAINTIKNIAYLRYVDLTFDYRDDLIVVEFEQENLF